MIVCYVVPGTCTMVPHVYLCCFHGVRLMFGHVCDDCVLCGAWYMYNGPWCVFVLFSWGKIDVWTCMWWLCAMWCLVHVQWSLMCVCVVFTGLDWCLDMYVMIVCYVVPGTCTMVPHVCLCCFHGVRLMFGHVCDDCVLCGAWYMYNGPWCVFVLFSWGKIDVWTCMWWLCAMWCLVHVQWSLMCVCVVFMG